jgi:hypothetical protein
MMYSVTVGLDKKRELKLDFEAIANIDEVLGAQNKDFFSVMMGLESGKINFNDLTLILYFGLAHEDEGLTEAKLKKIISKSMADKKVTVSYLIGCVAQAAKKAGIFSDMEEDEEGGESKDVPLPENG